MNRYAVGMFSAAVALLCVPSTVQAQVVGHPLLSRGTVDTATAFLYVDTTVALPTTGVVSSWAFFNNNAGDLNQSVAPIIFEQIGGTFVIRGVGTARTNASTGAQSFAFGLISGSDAVGVNYRMGWKDTSDGVIEFDGGGPNNVTWFGSDDPLTPGSTPTIDSSGARTYSVQFTISAATAAPEPGTAVLLGVAGSLLTLGAIARRKQRR